MVGKASSRTIRDSVRLLKAFRLEQVDPDKFYHLLAIDGVRLLSHYVDIKDLLIIDVGGGAGYFSNVFRENGARTLIVEPFIEELSWRGVKPDRSILGDGYRLPIKDSAADLVFSSNVLEHVEYPQRFLIESLRVTRLGGYAFACFTNWLSPWGGHETSPWHYLGGEFAKRRYVEKKQDHKELKNVYGSSLFPLSIKDALRIIRNLKGVELLYVGPRYLPEYMRGLVGIPVLREFLTWNLAILMRKTSQVVE